MDNVTEFRNWLETHISNSKTKSQDQSQDFTTRTFLLAGSMAFELALKEFNRLFECSGPELE